MASDTDKVFIEDSTEFMRTLNTVAKVRADHFHALARYLSDRPDLHALLAELVRQYPPKEPKNHI